MAELCSSSVNWGRVQLIKVYLPIPLSDTTRGENQIESTTPTPWQGSGTILLAEDEDQVRDIAKELLEFFGFTVLEAVNGKEALEVYQKNAAEITLVVTDMGMPVMDGYELFSELKKLNSDLPIIVSSGYGDVEVSAYSKIFILQTAQKSVFCRGEARVHLLRPSLIFAPTRAKHDEAVLSPLQKQNRICMPFEV